MSTSTRTALVTGATSGIGRAIAEALAADGKRVLVSGRNSERGNEVVAGIRKAGGNAEFVLADLASASATNDLAARAIQVLGQVDILVNNAGIFTFGATAEVTSDAFDAMYATNVRAPMLLSGRLAPAMATRGWGRIINTTTMVAHFGMAGAALYGSSKAALLLLTQVWAAEFGSAGVTANAIAPGPILTPGTEGMGDALPTPT